MHAEGRPPAILKRTLAAARIAWRRVSGLSATVKWALLMIIM
jgi:hypothetical protein